MIDGSGIFFLTVNDPRHPIRDNIMVIAPTAIKTYAADI